MMIKIDLQRDSMADGSLAVVGLESRRELVSETILHATLSPLYLREEIACIRCGHPGSSAKLHFPKIVWECRLCLARGEIVGWQNTAADARHVFSLIHPEQAAVQPRPAFGNYDDPIDVETVRFRDRKAHEVIFKALSVYTLTQNGLHSITATSIYRSLKGFRQPDGSLLVVIPAMSGTNEGVVIAKENWDALSTAEVEEGERLFTELPLSTQLRHVSHEKDFAAMAFMLSQDLDEDLSDGDDDFLEDVAASLHLFDRSRDSLSELREICDGLGDLSLEQAAEDWLKGEDKIFYVIPHEEGVYGSINAPSPVDLPEALMEVAFQFDGRNLASEYGIAPILESGLYSHHAEELWAMIQATTDVADVGNSSPMTPSKPLHLPGEALLDIDLQEGLSDYSETDRAKIGLMAMLIEELPCYHLPVKAFHIQDQSSSERGVQLSTLRPPAHACFVQFAFENESLFGIELPKYALHAALVMDLTHPEGREIANEMMPTMPANGILAVIPLICIAFKAHDVYMRNWTMAHWGFCVGEKNQHDQYWEGAHVSASLVTSVRVLNGLPSDRPRAPNYPPPEVNAAVRLCVHKNAKTKLVSKAGNDHPTRLLRVMA